MAEISRRIRWTGMVQDFDPVALPPKWQEPLYKSLARSIRERIDRGELQDGDQLPSQEEIALAARVNVRTVARAINLLVRDKVLVKRARGERARVASRSRPPAELSSAAEHVSHHRLRVTVQLISIVDGRAEVHAAVQEGERFVVPTTAAALEWLNLKVGQSATVDIKATEISLTNT